MFSELSGSNLWFNGKIIPWQEANIHIMTHALHYASSVYEGLRSYHGKIFKATEHYQRLHKSAAYLDFQIPYTSEELIEATQQLIIRDKYQYGYIRAIAWCGSKVMTVSHNGADVNVAIGIWERPLTYPSQYYSDGICMNIAQWRRPDPNTAPVHSKTAGLYPISSISKKEAEKQGFKDALMLDYQGNIAEATSSNIFLVINGQLYTPVPKCFLNGITRCTCLQIAKDAGIPTQEITLTLEDLNKAQEVFLTGTAIEILPVGSIVGHNKTWSFKPGLVTHTIRSNFQNMINNF
ncbi:putative branched-chain-amino-acid aminotransferase [Candidatus Xenohaliotis californiensis]|uniref:Branched-chain-amino-acid aminotransferase n=1 Tax=Candidatus Xenohaliotis californiensis TaxID=84677 RepID=A0ABP0EW77_9RICK|nr:putative branched-chain-amino-acid aminotransferase [Candidatus Xenohaliotis californiensis]